MFQIKGRSSSRKSAIGGLVEAFIDVNANFFSIEQIDLLESLAEEVDSEAVEQEGRIQELENELEEK